MAQSYLTLLRDGSGDPICFQAPRRLGKAIASDLTSAEVLLVADGVIVTIDESRNDGHLFGIDGSRALADQGADAVIGTYRNE